MNIDQLSFENGKIENFSIENPDIVVFFRQWNAKPYKLIFRNPLYLQYYGIEADTTNTTILTDSTEIATVKSKLIQDKALPASYNYFNFKQVNFIASDGFIHLSLIATAIDVVAR